MSFTSKQNAVAFGETKAAAAAEIGLSGGDMERQAAVANKGGKGDDLDPGI